MQQSFENSMFTAEIEVNNSESIYILKHRILEINVGTVSKIGITLKTDYLFLTFQTSYKRFIEIVAECEAELNNLKTNIYV